MQLLISRHKNKDKQFRCPILTFIFFDKASYNTCPSSFTLFGGRFLSLKTDVLKKAQFQNNWEICMCAYLSSLLSSLRTLLCTRKLLFYDLRVKKGFYFFPALPVSSSLGSILFSSTKYQRFLILTAWKMSVRNSEAEWFVTHFKPLKKE